MKLNKSILRKMIQEVMNESPVASIDDSSAADAARDIVKYYTTEYSKEPTGISEPPFKIKVKDICKNFKCKNVALTYRTAKRKLEEKGYTFH
jgi:hypothetical protein